MIVEFVQEDLVTMKLIVIKIVMGYVLVMLLLTIVVNVLEVTPVL